MRDNQSIDGKYKAVIITALSIEYEAVKKHISSVQEVTHPQGTVYECGKFSSCNKTWEIALVEIGQGNIAASTEAERAIQFFKPNVLMFIGVAGGIKDVKCGDVVVATKVYRYESGKDEASFKPRPDAMHSGYRLEQRARAEAKRDHWLMRIGCSRNASAFIGPIAAGEKVIASTKSATYSFLKENYGDVLAVEMEGYGCLGAVHANPGVEALVVRGISDLIDDKHASDTDGRQEIAAQNASAFAFEVLAKFDPVGKKLEEVMTGSTPSPEPDQNLTIPPGIKSMIGNVKLGDWTEAAVVALEIIKTTDMNGHNRIFELLLESLDNIGGDDDDEIMWPLSMIVELCCQLSPILVKHDFLRKMASHANFAIRSSAASICMDLSNFAPDRVPADILYDLSKSNEDWYVQAPANAAIKTLASTRPIVLQIYYQRVLSSDPGDREQAAEMLLDIANNEPHILDIDVMTNIHNELSKLGYKEAFLFIKKILPRIIQGEKKSRYKYGL